VSCEDLIACPAAKSLGILSVKAIDFALRKRLRIAENALLGWDAPGLTPNL
jgi:hypothetical protein